MTRFFYFCGHEQFQPAVLRERADTLPRHEVLGRYAVVASPDDVIDTYRPLVTDIDADVVAVQITSTHQERTIDMVGREVLPELRAISAR